MVSEVAESSHDRDEAAEREASGEAARQPQRSWVALASIPVVDVVYGANDARAEAIAPGAADLLLELHDPPRPSYLALPERLVPNARRLERNDFPRIVAVGSDRLLFMATRGPGDPDYFLCDVKAGTAARLPVVPLEMGLKLLSRRRPSPPRALHGRPAPR